ncbi:L-fucose mutarotase [Paenibacillus cremeus]|uniref:L-fucose mutarotase n=1 Tax=Paenibacillus cremeus TaxID=2163881 RepID=A0A559KD10_9BACL|nr:L-fucose mutarotase [Paenibacillus cremeus]TVY10020.1 L-fucose mutarotase [Paenibacillus cremeus]
MLKGIPSILSPELLKVLMEMGHGDEIVLADSNFPAASHAQRLLRADGLEIPALLDAILSLFPLDQYAEHSTALMAVVLGDPIKPVIWDEYRQIILKHEPEAQELELVERFAFYERAKKTYAIVATGESAQYANIILKKGVIKPSK